MQAVSLQFPVTKEGSWYPSLVLDFTEDREVVVGAPMSRGEEIYIGPDNRIGLEIPSPDGLRRYTAVVRRRSSSPPALHLTWPEAWERIQRRDNVRVETVFRVEVTRPGGPALPQSRASGLTADLSAGGIRIVTPIQIAPGEEVELTLELPEVGTRRARGRVLRGGETLGVTGEHRHWLAIEFTDIAETVRREITKIIFDVQRAQMRRT